MHHLPKEPRASLYRGFNDTQPAPHLQELRQRIEWLKHARDSLRAQHLMFGPDVSASDIADILDTELSRLLLRLQDWT
ncbi:hypothetical protein NCCP691_39210 [Noviherbaspirillum aridicola]|uniref:Uncharacterized protein n=1 Tax=Noviherbaspirillum aridicola TaxID=2849687 RepID=A0ABQ4Q9L3_9BURK|nr:hypothetical protein NCCP691_39210 [Noviherbaspirillum aridicola]